MNRILEQRELRPQGEAASLVTLSPDGLRLAWAETDARGAASICLADAEGGSATVRHSPARGLWPSRMAWSPDGSKLASLLIRRDLQPAAPVAISWLQASDGAELGSVPGSAFAWMPSARALAIADHDAGALLLHDLESGESEPLSELLDDGDPLFPVRLAVSSMGDQIAFTGHRVTEGVASVFVASPGRDPLQLTDIPGGTVTVFPFWSPGGTTLGLHILHPQHQKTGLVVVPYLQGEGEIRYQSLGLDPGFAPVFTPSREGIVLFRAAGVEEEPARSGPQLVWIPCSGETRMEALSEPGMAAGRLHFLDETRLAIDGGSAARLLRFEAPL